MIDRQLDLRCSPETAYAAFWQQIDAWWPPGHKLSGDPAGVVHMEPAVGGRFFERAPDGRELAYGQVTAFEPPDLLRYDFFPGTGADTPTEVTVRFRATDAGCRVTIQHGPGRCPPDRFDQTAHRFRAGWDRIATALTAHLSPHDRTTP